MIDESIILALVNEYDEVVYDKTIGLLKITVNKDYLTMNFKELMNRLSKQVPYPVCFFKSDSESYTFSYFFEEN